MDRARADYMGMLATVMNALALQAAIEARGPAGAGAVGDPDAHASASPISATRRSTIWTRAGW